MTSQTHYSESVSDTETEVELNVWIKSKEIQKPGLRGENSGLLADKNGVVLSFISTAPPHHIGECDRLTV